MNIKTRHGFEKPTEQDLADYQLGWSIEEGCLYIKDPTQDGEKVIRVLSDKALLDANQKFISELQTSLNKFSDSEISKAKEELKKLYEKKTTYVIEFGLPAEADKEEGVDYTTDTEFDYYTKETADEAVTAFIEKLNTTNIGNQDPDIKNAGSKIIISKADHSVAYLYMILEDEYGKEYGQLINTLEQSFPSLVLEWSEKKENTIEFKLNNEVLNEIDFSKMTVDEGSWSHGEGIKLNKSLDNEYVEYISPICFRAKQDCYVKPSKYIEYDDDYAYGYRNIESGIDNFKTNGAQANTENVDIFNPTKVGITLSENDKRNKYYSIFRIKDNSQVNHTLYAKNASYKNRAGLTSASNDTTGFTVFNTSNITSSSSASYLYNIDNYIPTEVYDNNSKQWVFLRAAYKAPCHNICPTSDDPIILNYYTSSSSIIGNTKSTDAVPMTQATQFSTINPDVYKILDDSSILPLFNSTSYIYNIGSSDNNPFFGKSNIRICDDVYKDNNYKFYSSYTKIRSDEFIKIEKGYKYVILEALDLNSRAYILPIYIDNKRKNIVNQLLDINQIIFSNPQPAYLENAARSSSLSNSSSSGTALSYNSSFGQSDIFMSDDLYEYTEITTNLRYMCFSDLIDSMDSGIYIRNSSVRATAGHNVLGGAAMNYNKILNRAACARAIAGFAPNYKYINVKGLNE